MYTYYFVSMHTDKIWWKKHLTKCQLLQFTCMLSQASHLLYNDVRGPLPHTLHPTLCILRPDTPHPTP
jgi:hypothetical protein